ncbi:MAG: Ig-like domain-containing protein [Candidatus Omnitrophota bacterium]
MNVKKTILSCALALSASVFSAAPSFAKTYDLVADEVAKIMPDAAIIQMWGFADTTAGTGSGIVTVPGPVLEVPAGDTTLTINLTNNLTVPVSIVIPGQAAALAPAYFDAADPDYPERVRSMAAETLPGDTGVYTWTNLRPGTYLYQSGTHPQVQVQMGLYGAAKVFAADGNAYPSLISDTEFTLLYSEIDPALHGAVSTGQYGPGTTMTSTINYNPRYFLVNGEPYTPGQLSLDINLGQRVLLRLLNAGLQTHVPTIQDAYLKQITENGNPYPYQREQYEILLSAGATADALFVPDASSVFALYDRMLALRNADGSQGGLFSQFNVAVVPGSPVAGNDAFSVNKNTVLNVIAPGVLINDSDPDADPITPSLISSTSNGTLTFNIDGSFIYTPNLGYVGVDSFTYRLSDGTNISNIAVVTLTVANGAPISTNDAYSVDEDATLTIVAPGVLGNDTDPDGDLLSALLAGSVTNGVLTLNSDGSFTYTPNANFNGVDAFTYVANDGSVNGNIATVDITVNPTNDAPVANNDSTTTNQNTAVSINVLANDTDLDNNPLTVTNLTNGANGITALNPDNTVTYTPNSGFSGTDTFTYTANDSLLDSAAATVTVTVNTAVQLQVIIDNTSSNIARTGLWSTSTAPNPYGTNSLQSRNGATFSWLFTPTVSGVYDVSMWWTQLSSRATNIPVDIQNVTGTNRVFINQQLNGGQWNSFGAYEFQAGVTYRVTITSQAFPTTTCADAVQFTLQQVTSATVIIDNTNTTNTSRTGSWSTSTAPNPYGTNSLQSRNGTTFSWLFTPVETKTYNVSMWWTQSTSRATNIPVDIEHAGGTSRVFINQQTNGGQWNLLSTFDFQAGVTYRVTITSQAFPTTTCADAVRFE